MGFLFFGGPSTKAGCDKEIISLTQEIASIKSQNATLQASLANPHLGNRMQVKGWIAQNKEKIERRKARIAELKIKKKSCKS